MAVPASELIPLAVDPRAESSVATHLGGRSDRTHLRAAPSPRVRVIRGRQDLGAGSSWLSWTTLTDAVLLLGVAWAVPVAALAIGVPIVLAVSLLLWIVRLAIGAF